ncbi:MAG: ATP-binding protein, partial [Bdellovibrionales bacterium]|nr:ATP-binding protein [Bdellovibrionales bacterium]
MEPKFDRSFEVAHETRYPIVNKPRAIEFAELFGSVPLKRCLVELCPAQQDRSLPNITLLDPGPRADLETFLSFKDTRRAAAKASGWQAVVNEPRFRAELSEVAASGLVQENPGIAKELDRYNLSPQDREACVDHIRLRYDFLFSWCFEELLMNAAQYGNSGDPNKILEVATGYQHDGHFVFWIKDQGNGYNPSRLPNPTDQELREVPSGRGLYTL